MTYKVEYMEAEGTGAGYGLPAHQYASHRAVTFSRSIKQAVRQAKREVAQSLPGWIPVFDALRVTDASTGRVIINR